MTNEELEQEAIDLIDLYQGDLPKRLEAMHILATVRVAQAMERLIGIPASVSEVES